MIEPGTRRWISRRFMTLVFLFFSLGIGGGVLLAEQPVHQPSPYNHSIHTKKMDCIRCHRGSREGRFAGLPSLVICADCHATAPGKKPKEVDRTLWSKVLAGKPPTWNRIDRIPQSTFFSHRQHTTVSQIVCEECHGGMKDRTTPPEFSLKPLRMRSCIGCHEKEKVTVDCTSCHR